MGQDVVEIWSAYVESLGAVWPGMLGLACLGVGGFVLGRGVLGRLGPVDRRWIETLLVSAFVVAGVAVALSRASVFDDAYISFRYARNLVEGHGLVFNPGEFVEGITNFLWTLAIAFFLAVTPFEAPLIGLVGSLVCFAANLLVVHRIARVLAGATEDGPEEGDGKKGGGSSVAFVFPLALALLAFQGVFTAYGTTGLETAAASLLVNGGLLLLLTGSTPFRAGGAGTLFALAILTRPDHAVFHAAGGVALLAARPAARAVIAYVAPLVGVAAVLGWKLYYYGDLLPNPFYAKSAALPYWEQGIPYAVLFHLSTHYWLVALLFAAWCVLPSDREAVRRFRWFSVPAVVAYELYVMRVGGDFMHGRFFVSLMPIFLLGATDLVRLLVRRRSVAAVVVSGLLVATTGGVSLVEPRTIRWHVADESTFYPVVDWFPIEIGHSNDRFGRELGDLRRGGVSPVVLTGAVGLIGYYSRLEIVDRAGITDRFVARLPLDERGRPGHEKRAPPAYLDERGVHLIRGGGYVPAPYRRIARFRFPPQIGRKRWYIHRYEREMMRRVRALKPEIRFVDFEEHLDRYIERLPSKRTDRIRRDLRWFRDYYFDHNDDPERLESILRVLRERALVTSTGDR